MMTEQPEDGPPRSGLSTGCISESFLATLNKKLQNTSEDLWHICKQLNKNLKTPDDRT
jgi:hypothetical protein